MIIHQNVSAINEGFIKNLVHRVKASIRIDKEVKAEKPDCLKAIDETTIYIDAVFTRLQDEAEEIEKYLKEVISSSSEEFSVEQLKKYVASMDEIAESYNRKITKTMYGNANFLCSEKFVNEFFGDSKVNDRYWTFAKMNLSKCENRMDKLDNSCENISELYKRFIAKKNCPNDIKNFIKVEIRRFTDDCLWFTKQLNRIFDLYIKYDGLKKANKIYKNIDSKVEAALEFYDQELIEL